MEANAELLPLSQLAKRLPAVRGKKPPSRMTLYRWATVGLKSRSGRRIRLETQFVGGTLCASLDDVRRLCDSKDDVEWTPPEFQSHREQYEMKRRADAAIARLRKKGLLGDVEQDYSQAI